MIEIFINFLVSVSVGAFVFIYFGSNYPLGKDFSKPKVKWLSRLGLFVVFMATVNLLFDLLFPFAS